MEIHTGESLKIPWYKVLAGMCAEGGKVGARGE